MKQLKNVFFEVISKWNNVIVELKIYDTTSVGQNKKYNHRV